MESKIVDIAEMLIDRFNQSGNSRLDFVTSYILPPEEIDFIESFGFKVCGGHTTEAVSYDYSLTRADR
ncbi:MAG: hypothetical protein K0Q79_2757 [Flavipsychrobacter sp.]|jgi:hypothetical protein|nr:hypothetical protein [Flavipsychrobacter sp.]